MSAITKVLSRRFLSNCDNSLKIYPQRNFSISARVTIQQQQKPLPIIQSELELRTFAAFKSGDFEDGWRLLRQLSNQKPANLPEFYKHYFDSCAKLTEDERVSNVSQLLQQLEVWQVLLDADAAGRLVDTLAGTVWDVQRSTVDSQSGGCQRCGAVVKKTVVTDEWFDLLKNTFVEKVVLPEEVYVKSTPAEWERFNRLLAETLPFTHVIDAASVAGSGFLNNPFREPIRAPRYVLSAVKQIKEAHPASKLLVVCKEYMKQWHPSFLKQLPEHATVFFRQNPYEDDAYFLYAAMLSGITCKFISRSNLKQHQHALDNVELQRMFRQWQQRSQQSIQVPLFESDMPIVLPPMVYNSSRLTLGDHIWHLPYDDGCLAQSYEQPATWLCARHS